MPVYGDEKLNIENDEEQSPSSKLDYTVRLSSEEREDLGRRLKYEIEKYHAFTETRRSNCIQWRRDY